MVFVLDFLLWATSLPIVGLSLACFIYVFSVLEYINYYHIQLSYDNFSDIKYFIKTRRLKQACIRKDFERLKGEVHK